MIKDEEQLIANLMYRMHANEQARLDAALSSARADAVTRAEADRVRMESVTEELRKEREAHAETAELLNKGDAKVRNMEHTHSVVLSRITIERDSLKDMLDRQTPACNKLILEGHELRAERDALRAEVAALQESLRAEKKQGDALWCEAHELRKLKSQIPKHPVKVGEWVRRLVPSPACGVGTVAKVVQVDDTSEIYDVKRIDGQHGVWFAKNCEPCDPPEATHDTNGGKAAAEAAVKIEPVADDIKVGDLGEVFQATTRTLNTDIGITGRVSSVYLDQCHGGFLVKFDPSTQSRRSTGMQAFGLCDVRKVTT